MDDWFKNVRERIWLEGDPNRDRSRGLVVFGVLEVGLGILAFSLAMLLLVTVSATGIGGMKLSHFRMSMVFMFLLTAWFIVIGLGSMKACRWARALVLVGAWIAVLFGTFGLALMLYVLPGMYTILLASGQLDPRFALSLLYGIVFSLIVLQVVFPLVAIGFYSLAGVQATCERKHPASCWSDRYPVPLLTLGFILALGGLSIIAESTINYVVFLFGRIFSGMAGMLIMLLISAACGYVGWGALKCKKHAWWGAYALVLLVSSSMMLTFSELDMPVLYSHMGYNEQQIQQLTRVVLLNPATLTFASGIWGVMACIYLVWIRDCFLPGRGPVEIKSFAQRKAEEEAATKRNGVQGPRMRLEH